jgi:DNA-binding CsgD family transcriptional regulator
MRLGFKSQVILAGAGLAAAAFALEWLEYKYFVRSLSTEVYVVLLVTFFTGLGIWVGHKFSGPGRQSGEQEINEKALAALGITHREHAVLTQLAKGSSNKQIARDLGISPNTVKTHIANVYTKLKVSGRMQAVSAAQELRILPS